MSVSPATSRDESAPAKSAGRRFGPNHRWTVLGIGCAAQASFSASFSGIPVTGTTMRSDYHLTNGMLGVVLGSISLGIAASEILWGIWTDRFGERRVLLTGLIATGVVLGLMSVAVVPGGGSVPHPALLVIGLLLVGAFGGSVNGSSGRAVMAWFREGQRGFAMSIRQTAVPAGGAIGTAVLPWLAVTYGFRVVFIVLALLCFLAAGATAIWLHQPQEAAPAPGAAPAAAPVAGPSPLRRWDIWRMALSGGMLTVPQIAVLTAAGVYLHDAKHAGLGVIVPTVLVAQVGGATARIWSGRYTDKHGNRRRVIRVIGLLTGVVMAAAAILTSAPTLVVAAALAVGGLLANAWHGVAYTEIASMAGANRAGTALGLENTTVFTGAFLTPMLVPVIEHAFSWTVVWAVIAVLPLAAVMLSPGAVRAKS